MPIAQKFMLSVSATLFAFAMAAWGIALYSLQSSFALLAAAQTTEAMWLIQINVILQTCTAALSACMIGGTARRILLLALGGILPK